jgi:hypothetical protein
MLSSQYSSSIGSEWPEPWFDRHSSSGRLRWGERYVSQFVQQMASVDETAVPMHNCVHHPLFPAHMTSEWLLEEIEIVVIDWLAQPALM